MSLDIMEVLERKTLDMCSHSWPSFSRMADICRTLLTSRLFPVEDRRRMSLLLMLLRI